MKEYVKELIAGIPNMLTQRSMVREYLQARILQAIQESGAFLNWAFLGGTSLRFLYNLPRYSEDLDFAVQNPGTACRFAEVMRNIKSQFEAENYLVDIKVSSPRTVMSAFVKFPGLLHTLGLSPYDTESLAIKVEIDTNPPDGAVCVTKVVRRYVTVQVLHYDKASLLAGKLHAILNRTYTKGRDIYDFVWYLSDSSWPSPNYQLLNAAMRQTGWQGEEINQEVLRKVLLRRIEEMNFNSVLADVRPFLERPQDAVLLTRENCMQLTDQKFS